MNILSLFQTASGTWHLPSILMVSSWILSFIVTGFFIFANLKVNRNERISSFQKEQKILTDSKETRLLLETTQSELTEAKNKIKTLEPKPFDERLRLFLKNLDPRILPALKTGTRCVDGNVQPYQLTELQKLCSEKESQDYIKLEVNPALILTTQNQVYAIKMILILNL